MSLKRMWVFGPMRAGHRMSNVHDTTPAVTDGYHMREGGDEMNSRQTEWTAREEMLRGVPTEHRRLTVEGVSTSVLESGAGPTMILLHGGIECGGVTGHRSSLASRRPIGSSCPTSPASGNPIR